MSKTKIQAPKIKMTWKQKNDLLVPYIKKRIIEQIKAVAIIIIYLILFQTMVLNIQISEASIIASGLAVVIFGLAFFMEGLFLGLMPLGDTIGVKLPQKSKVPVILIFSFILGVGVTFAEPAIGVLKAAGSFVKPWDAPLLFLLLNKFSNYLVYAVGIGVGLAVLAGMLRFIYNWSLKPYLYIGITGIIIFSIWAEFNPNLRYILGVAWDCGGVTTGPVTVPLVLALGIGISRIVSKSNSELSGFGVVTLASLFPIYTVLICGLLFINNVPKPMSEDKFYLKENFEKASYLFIDKNDMIGYALKNAKPENQLLLFDNDNSKMMEYISQIKSDEKLRTSLFGSANIEILEKWVIDKGTDAQKIAVFGTRESAAVAARKYAESRELYFDIVDLIKRNFRVAIQAIIPLVLFLILVLLLVLREKLKAADEIILGIIFAVIGMFLFNIGIELGLAKLGNQVGSKLPCSFKKIELSEQKRPILNFDESIITTAITPSGEKEKFFYAKINTEYVNIPYRENELDKITKNYIYTPTKGPMFGREKSFGGYMLVLLFAFIMGYGATLAEPALNALGVTVESLTVGTFKKNLLMNTVAIGVGLGMVVGLIKIIWNIPLIWLLTPPYIVLLFLTKVSSEEFVNIGWDSAGVTTGPITVPLVLAMGLGIGTQINVVEGFGILAAASCWPILCVLSMGLYINMKRKRLEKES